MTELALVLPMYNERDNIERVVRKAIVVLETLAEEFEVLIVDDASCDGSERIADELALRYPQVRIIRHACNMGYGAALRTGFQHAAKDLVFYTDSDEPIDLCEIERALRLIGPDVDLAIGYRIDRYDTPLRYVYSRVYNFLCRCLFGIRARDVNFSFKLIKRTVLDRIRLQAGSVFIDGELLAEAARYGYRVAELPVQYFPRRNGHSNFDNLRAATHALEEVVSYWWRTRVRRLP
jgi:glycosyltransferase involved in cell wall biosynthesis